MKALLYIVCAFCIASCSSSGIDQARIVLPDSVSYTAATPGRISADEFARYRRAIQSFYDTFLIPRGFNGAILAAKKGNIVFEAYNGYSNLAKKEYLTPRSSFHLASVSKTFTAMAVLKLVELGRLKLDDDLILYFPTLPYEGITVKMLLNHRSGLPNYIYFMEKLGWDITKVSANKDVLDFLIRFRPPLTHTPGTRFSYCNTNYALLALLIEKVTGKTYPEFIQFAFFKPLRMDDTYVFSMADSAKAMPSYDWRWRPAVFNFLDGEYGDKNIYSTPRDLLKWDQALYSNQLFKRQTLAEAFTPYSNEKPGIKNYGLGWRMDVYPNGKKIIFHTGWWHGNNSLLVHLVEDSATIIVLSNKYNRSVYEAKKLANVFGRYFDIKDEEKTEVSRETSVVDEVPDSTRIKTQQYPKVRPARKHKKRR